VTIVGLTIVCPGCGRQSLSVADEGDTAGQVLCGNRLCARPTWVQDLLSPPGLTYVSEQLHLTDAAVAVSHVRRASGLSSKLLSQLELMQ
jgi:hypothetical protein